MSSRPAVPRQANDVAKRQVDDDLKLLQKAAASLHRDVQWLESVRLGVSCLVAIAGLAATLSHWKSPLIPLMGLVWVLSATGLIAPAIKRRQRLAAITQEMFDTRLFGLAWSWGIAGDELPAHEVAKQARRLPLRNHRQEWIRSGWYETSTLLKHSDAVIACQLQNLGWDSRLRQRYAAALTSALVVWIAGGIALGLATDATVENLLLTWFIPSAGVLSASVELIARQRSSARERDRLFNAAMRLFDTATAQIPTKDVGSAVPTRQIQDGIFLMRVNAPRVPNALYVIHRRRDQTDFADLVGFVTQRASERDRAHAKS